uniref:CS domain-containing protein n=1 Tax=Noctiluca scintillans TaxID=2966 RepID=A0A7S1F8Y5_NOCSC
MQEESKEVQKLSDKARGRQQFLYDGRVVYEWEQCLDEVHIFIQPPPGVTKYDLDIKITPRHLAIGLKGNPPFLNEDTWGVVETAASFWMIEDGELHIQFQKAHKAEMWSAALKGHGQLDMFSEQEVNKKLMLERFQEEHPGFDFTSAQFSGMAPNARTFMGGVHADPRSVKGL